MRRTDDLHGLLRAAERLVKRNPAPTRSVRIEGRQFAVVAERNAKYGWILILLEDRCEALLDEQLKEMYDLSDRQLQVAWMMADRYSNQDIADKLGIKLSTVKRHVEHVFAKVGVRSRREVNEVLNHVRGR